MAKINPSLLGTPQYVDGTKRNITCSPNETTWWKISSSQMPTIPSGHVLLRYEAVCDKTDLGDSGLGGMGYNNYDNFYYISTINAGNMNRTFNIWIRAWYL